MRAGMNAIIRRLESAAELEECVKIQSLVWGLSPGETVSESTLAASLRHQALLLGCFSGKILVGFCFSIPSIWRGAGAHHSHMLAVLPEFRDRGIGFLLKTAQFNALRERVDWITWTFDPLESRNARLNLKLGVTISSYLRDLYGDGENCALHKGLGTDRFIAEWATDGRPRLPEKHLPPVGETPFSILHTEWDEKGFYRPSNLNLTLTESALYLEIPENIQKIKQDDPGCAVNWREMTRTAAEHFFAAGFTVRNFHTWLQTSPRCRRSFYILTRP